MKPRDRFGWPVEFVMNHPITNFLRFLFLTDILKTLRNKKIEESKASSSDCNCQQSLGE